MMIMALVVLGLFSYRRLNIDQFPDVEFPLLVIQTRYPGASPESVEREVSKQIEEQVNTVEGIKQIQSTSTEGFSTIIVLFNLGTKVMDPPVISRANPSDQPIFVLSVQGRGWVLRDLTRLADEVVSRRIENISGVGSVPVRLGQIARIEDAQEEARDAAYVNGERAVALEIRKTSGANTVLVTDGVKRVIEELKHTLPNGIGLATVQDNSTWIRNSVDDVQKTLIEGAFLTVLIVFLFLNSWRSTVITGLTLPVSVGASFLA